MHRATRVRQRYQASTWVTQVRGGNIPAYLGTDQRRHFSIRGGGLIIAESGEVGGKSVYRERVLVREPRRWANVGFRGIQAVPRMTGVGPISDSIG